MTKTEVGFFLAFLVMVAAWNIFEAKKFERDLTAKKETSLSQVSEENSPIAN